MTLLTMVGLLLVIAFLARQVRAIAARDGLPKAIITLALRLATG
jgi:hypothetical protein